jgi:hypothetical protein
LKEEAMKKSSKKGSKKQGTGQAPAKAAKPEKAEAPPEEAAAEKPAEAAPPPDLTELRKPVEVAKGKMEAAQTEAKALEDQAGEIRAKAKTAFQEALGPYREACRKAKVECEFGGTKAPPVAPRVRFLLEKVKEGIKVTIKGRPETEQVIPTATLKESVGKAALAYCETHLGSVNTQGAKHAGLGNRLRALMK